MTGTGRLSTSVSALALISSLFSSGCMLPENRKLIAETEAHDAAQQRNFQNGELQRKIFNAIIPGCLQSRLGDDEFLNSARTLLTATSFPASFGKRTITSDAKPGTIEAITFASTAIHECMSQAIAELARTNQPLASLYDTEIAQLDENTNALIAGSITWGRHALRNQEVDAEFKERAWALAANEPIPAPTHPAVAFSTVANSPAPLHADTTANSKTIPLTLKHGVYYAAVTIDGIEHTGILDSGSSSLVLPDDIVSVLIGAGRVAISDISQGAVTPQNKIRSRARPHRDARRAHGREHGRRHHALCGRAFDRSRAARKARALVYSF
jgi:hypothetical protein